VLDVSSALRAIQLPYCAHEMYPNVMTQMTFKSLVNFGRAPWDSTPIERYHSEGGGHHHRGYVALLKMTWVRSREEYSTMNRLTKFQKLQGKGRKRRGAERVDPARLSVSPKRHASNYLFVIIRLFLRSLSVYFSVKD
jgi:hypothetical protein